MTRKMLLVAVSAICGLALLATPALAKEWESNKSYPTRFKIAGKGRQVGSLEGLAVECEQGSGEGQLKAASPTLQGSQITNTGNCTMTIAGVKHKVKTEVKECEGLLILTEGKGTKQQGVAETINKGTGKCLVTRRVEGTTCETKSGAQGPIKGFRAEQVTNSKGEGEVQIRYEASGIMLEATSGCGIASKAKLEIKGQGRVEGVKIR